MNKKILIAVIVVFGLLIGAIIWLLLDNPKKTAPAVTPSEYSLSISEINAAVSATTIIQNSFYELASSDIGNYALITFNSTHDLMWVQCPKTYTLSSPVSSTQNKITYDPVLNAVNLELSAKNNNSLQLVCKK